MTLIIVGAVLIVLGAGLLPWLARRSARRAETFAQVPRYDCAQVAEHGREAPGMRLSVVGRSAPGTAPLIAPASGRECAWYRLTVSERHREERRDSEGNTRTEIVERQVSDERSPDLFALTDGGGRTLVDPAGADIDRPVETVDRSESTGTGGMRLELGGLNINIGASGTLVGVRTQERIIPLDHELYVLGGAGERGGEGLIGRPRSGPHVISTRNAGELATGARRAMWALASVGAVCAVTGVILAVVGLVS